MHNESEKKDIISISINLLVVIFVFFTYFVIVAYLSQKPEGQYLVVWFIGSLEKYGVFFASVPVIIGVAVAKQQLDANRKQHIANVKRSLKKELDSLYVLIDFSKSVLKASSGNFILSFNQGALGGVPIDVPTENDLSKMEDYLSKNTIDAAKRARQITENVIDVASGDLFIEEVGVDMTEDKLIDLARKAAIFLLNRSNQEMVRLSEYWA